MIDSLKDTTGFAPIQGEELEQLRADTPGTATTTHLLACGASLMSKPVLDAVHDYLALEATRGGYTAQALCEEQLADVYSAAADLVGASSPEEIALQNSATSAWSRAFYALKLEAGDKVLTSRAEYGSNYAAMLQRAAMHGIVVELVPNDVHGQIDLEQLESMIDERTKLVALTWIPTHGGLVNPAKAVGEICKRHNVTYLVDACQAIGQLPVDVTDLNCDILSATGRKFLRGPRGTGFLWVRQSFIDEMEPAMVNHWSAEWVEPHRFNLRPTAQRFERHEAAHAMRAGFGVAIRYAIDVGIERIQQRTWYLADLVRSRIEEIPGAQVHDLGVDRCAIVTFTLEGHDSEDVYLKARDHNVAIGKTRAEAAQLEGREGIGSMIRVAPHYYNTEEEIDRLFEILPTK